MKPFTLQKQHLRQAALRKLTIAGWIGGMLTFLFGAWIAPWIWSIRLWLTQYLPRWPLPETFPTLVHFLSTPNVPLGLLWLAYYIVTYVWAKVARSPRQKQRMRLELARQRQQGYYEEWSPSGILQDETYAVLKKAEAALSQAWPGELKHQLVEQCYQDYRKALLRFDPPPIDLKTPETFFYRKAGHIEWQGSTLILPEEILTPKRIHELLPFLAHYLADYHTEHITHEQTDDFPDYVPLAPLLAITGNCLWLPVAYKHATEEQRERDALAQQQQQVRDRDEFAVLLGQGVNLQRQLRRMEEDLKQRGERDTSLPTLIERIGRLEVFNAREREDMRALGLSPQEPPLVSDPAPRQIEDKNQHA